ncbi:MAG: hypothetical protein JNN15_20480 [Blastocatellia bacterium]|nr:hypothetical protein [Blastocatellia bacterium]
MKKILLLLFFAVFTSFDAYGQCVTCEVSVVDSLMTCVPTERGAKTCMTEDRRDSCILRGVCGILRRPKDQIILEDPVISSLSVTNQLAKVNPRFASTLTLLARQQTIIDDIGSSRVFWTPGQMHYEDYENFVLDKKDQQLDSSLANRSREALSQGYTALTYELYFEPSSDNEGYLLLKVSTGTMLDPAHTQLRVKVTRIENSKVWRIVSWSL